uniref:Uncharacterized protein n=1 Tax=Oryza glumipatula TaxID=40148 RepID=A0A0D9YXA6_9ORYZ
MRWRPAAEAAVAEVAEAGARGGRGEAAAEAGTRVRLGRARRSAGLEWRRRAAAFPVSAQAQMAVQRELAVVVFLVTSRHPHPS